MTDFFAEAYGWSKAQINEVYPEEVPKLVERISEKKRSQKVEQAMGWLFTIASGFNPQEEWIKTLQGSIQKLSVPTSSETSTTAYEDKPYWQVTELDREGMNRVKQELQKVKESRSG